MPKYILRNGKWVASPQHALDCAEILEENNEADDFFELEKENE